MLVLSVLLVSVFIARWVWKRATRLPVPLPPGPPADPLIGHTRIFPQTNLEVALRKWSMEYGDVMHFSLLGKSIVVLSSYQAAQDLFDKRGVKYSSRPRFPVYEIIGWSITLPLLPAGANATRQRKIFQQTFNKQASLAFLSQQRELSWAFMKNLLENPEDFFGHVNRFVVAEMMEITYGYTVASEHDPYVEMVEKVNNIQARLGGNKALLAFPALKYLPEWFPGAGFVRIAKAAASITTTLTQEPFNEVRRRMAIGTNRPCFVSLRLEGLENEGGASEQDVEDLKIAAVGMSLAGSETTFAAIVSFFAAMVLHPEVQIKAQAEIDAIVGLDRLPDFSDRPSLPYVESVMYEVMRWCPAAPLSVPRETTADDVYKGMYIPKGATVIANTAAMSLDESVYSDPHSFRPERFLSHSPEPLPTDFFFGFGRRICPGSHLADASLWIIVASVLAAFEISPTMDDDGARVAPEITFTSGITCHPEYFPCQIRPRSHKMSEIIRQL